MHTRNNRISNASFPNRFNPSVKYFNFELIIHNPCHNSTISRIKINNPVYLGILPVNSYTPESMISFFFQEIQTFIFPTLFSCAIYCTSSVFLILLYNFLYYIPFIVHIIFYTTVYCTLLHFFKLSSYVSPKANSVHHSSFTLLVFSRFTVVYSDCWKELEMDFSQAAVNGIISNSCYALCTKYILL